MMFPIILLIASALTTVKCFGFLHQANNDPHVRRLLLQGGLDQKKMYSTFLDDPYQDVDELECSVTEIGRAECDVTSKKVREREAKEFPLREIKKLGLILLAVGSVIGLITSKKLLERIDKVEKAQDVLLLISEVVVEIAVGLTSGLLLVNEFEAQARELMRLSQNAKLSVLKVRTQDTNLKRIRQLSDFRRGRGVEKRVIIFVGDRELVEKCMSLSTSFSQQLVNNNLLVVPIVTQSDSKTITCAGEETSLTELVGQEHIGLPLSLDQWQEMIQYELKDAASNKNYSTKQGYTMIINTDGRVGQRINGMPSWGGLIAASLLGKGSSKL